MRLTVSLGACVLVLAVFLVLVGGRAGATSPGQDRILVVAHGLNQPVDVVAAPGQPGVLYVVERPGQVVMVRKGRVGGTFLDVRSLVDSGNDEEQGLLSLVFSPGYRTNHRFYVAYTAKNWDTTVAEYRSRSGVAASATARVLLDVPHRSHPNHNGGDLQFDKNGLLYVGTGDGDAEGDPNDTAQDLNSQLGKLWRIDPLEPGARWQMIGYGLRNPWRYSFDSKTGALWIGDVGYGHWEEIDYRAASDIGKLANYGWPIDEGDAPNAPTEPLSHAGPLVWPIYVYNHQNGNCAIIGGYVYRGKIAADQGKYYFGDYCSGTIWTLTRNSGHVHVGKEPFTVPQLSGFGQDAAGNLYATSLTGTLYQITR